MNTYIALIRGINVGGKNILPMAELRNLLDKLKLHDVQTYIQSGNVVFRAESTDPYELSERIQGAISRKYGIVPTVPVLKREELQEVMAANPFPGAEEDPSRLHLYFLTSPAEQPDLEGLKADQKETEQFKLADRCLYLHAPDGIGRSKLANNVDKHLGVETTARNWRTLTKILDMVGNSR